MPRSPAPRDAPVGRGAGTRARTTTRTRASRRCSSTSRRSAASTSPATSAPAWRAGCSAAWTTVGMRRATTSTSTTCSCTPTSSPSCSTRSSSTSRASSGTRRPGTLPRRTSCCLRSSDVARAQPIRVWSAGCASGEEAYSIAMLLAEALGVEEFRDRVKIYATDVDEEALAHARHATYSAQGAGVRARGAAREVLRAERQRVRVPQGAAPVRDLRSQRPDPGRPDLARRPAAVPQHADVLQRRGPVPDPQPAPLRAAARRHPVPGQGRDAAQPHFVLPAGRAQAAVLREGRHRWSRPASGRQPERDPTADHEARRGPAPAGRADVVGRRAARPGRRAPAGAVQPPGHEPLRPHPPRHRSADPGPGGLLPAPRAAGLHRGGDPRSPAGVGPGRRARPRRRRTPGARHPVRAALRRDRRTPSA